MRVLFIEAIGAEEEKYRSKPGLGLGYIASYIKANLKNIEVKIVNTEVEKIIASFQPDLIGVSSVSVNFGYAQSIANLCAEYDVPVIVGGPHITALPLSLTPQMTAGVIGEGELTMLEILKLFLKYGKKMPLEKIDGIVYWDNMDLKFTGPRELIQSLDILPSPDYELLGRGSRDIRIFTSRGCPYNCIFCFSTRFWKRVRYFSAEYVVDEIEYIINKYRPTYISIGDDLFISNRGRLRNIVSYIRQKGIDRRVDFLCTCRANLVDKEVATLLKHMNVRIVSMGLESGCNRILKYLKGGNISVEENMKAVDILVSEGMKVNASFIIGSPDETENEMLETLNFIKKSKISQFEPYILTPYPGTPIWDYAMKEKLVSQSMDWLRLKQELRENNLILSKKISRNELERIYCLFEKEKRRRNFLAIFKIRVPELIRKSIRYPEKILPWVIHKTKKVIKIR